MMIFGTSMYVLASGTATLTSLMEYTDLLSFETWYAADSWFIGTEVLGFNMFRVFAFVGSVIQHLAIFFTYYLILDNMGIIDRLRRRYEARRAGTGGC
jgi:hypothetical protein